MAKCKHCDSEVILPFVCPYCGETFCAEHRLPESHRCLHMPREPFWYQRRKAAQKEIERERTIKDGESFSDLKLSRRSFKNALIATLVIALLIGGSILMPIIAGTTQNPIIVLFLVFGSNLFKYL